MAARKYAPMDRWLRFVMVASAVMFALNLAGIIVVLLIAAYVR